MRVLDLKTRTVLDVEACYGARLIGQGRAVLAPAEPEKPVNKVELVEAEAEEPKAEEPKATKAKAKKG